MVTCETCKLRCLASGYGSRYDLTIAAVERRELPSPGLLHSE